MAELRCANGSQERAMQAWSVAGAEAFEIDYNQAFDLTLDSSKVQYDFKVCYPDGVTVAYTLTWQGDRWSGAKDPNFVFAISEAGVLKLSCMY